MQRLITACFALVLALPASAAAALTPGPHQDPDAVALAKALDFALLQAVSEHRACLTAERFLGDDLAKIEAALTAKDADTLRPLVGGIGPRMQWIQALEARAERSQQALDALDTRIHARSAELGAIVFSGHATIADCDRARDFAALENEMISDPDFHELYVNAEVRLFDLTQTASRLAELRSAVEALLGTGTPKRDAH